MCSYRSMSIIMLNKISGLGQKPQNRVESALPFLDIQFFL